MNNYSLHHCMAPDKEHVTIQVKQVTDNVIGSFDKNGDLI